MGEPHFYYMGRFCMKLVSISKALLKLYNDDKEVLHKDGRPYVLILRLTYRGMWQDFAIPMRSNIPANAQKEEYFALPPRPQTRKGNRHGLHYTKMFPVSKKYLQKYHIEGNEFAILIKQIIEKNAKKIIAQCQAYLTNYEHGKHPLYSTSLDLLLEKLHEADC